MKADYAKKYFDLANVITGFAIVQMIAFLIALGTSQDLAGRIARSEAGWAYIFSGMLVATVFYIVAVVACTVVEARLLPSAERDIVRLTKWTTAGRVIAIAAISGFGLFILCRIDKVVG